MSLTGRLRRRTSSEKYIPGVDGLRFAAIVSVILLHVFNQNQPQTVPWGYAALNQHAAYLFFLRFVWHGMRGVNIFFAISGFILALPFARYHLHRARPVSLSYYFLRRLTRLEPPYLLVLLVRLPLLVLLEPHVGHYYLQHFAASCFYLHNAVFGTSSVINPPAWSLEIEIQFYCLVPVLAYYFAIRRPMLRRAAMLATIASIGLLQVAYLPYQGRIGLSILVWLQYFLADSLSRICTSRTGSGFLSIGCGN